MTNKDEEYMNQFIKANSEGNNFVDYFVTIGLDSKIIFDDWLYENDLDSIISSDLFKPSFLTKFPPFDKNIINIDENLIQHCFPNGYFPIKSNSKPKEKAFSLVLDNNFYRIEFPKKYCACLLFWESFECYYKAYLRYKLLNEYSEDKEILTSDTDKRLSNKQLINVSKEYNDLKNQEFSDDEKRQNFISLNKLKSNNNSRNSNKNRDKLDNSESSYFNNNAKESINSNNTISSNNSNTLPPIHYHSNSCNSAINSNKIKIISFKGKICNKDSNQLNSSLNYSVYKDSLKNRIVNNTKLDATNTSVMNSLDEDRFLRLQENTFRKKFKDHYAPKIICLISVYPLISDFIRILKSIYCFSLNDNIAKPIEKIIDNLTLEIPVPPRGQIKVEYKLLNQVITLKQAKMNELPNIPYNFALIFCLLSIENCVDIFKNLLVENRIVFFSENIEYLGPIIDSFINLLFPLKYQFIYISVAGEDSLIYLLENPSPFVFGINQKFKNDFFVKFDMDSTSFVIVDIDNGKLYYQYCSDYYKLNDEKKKLFVSREFPDIPNHYRLKLIKKLTNDVNILFKQIGFNNKKDLERINLENKISQGIINSIRDHFFQFLVNIFQRYNEFLNLDYYSQNQLGQPTLNSMFHIKEFKKTKSSDDIFFYDKLFETQMVTSFIMNRMFPVNSSEKLEILLFDEHLFKKINRSISIKSIFGNKKQTPFCESKDYDITTNFPANKSSWLSDQEKLVLKFDTKEKEVETRKKFILLGQDILIDQNSKELKDTDLKNSILFKSTNNNSISNKSNSTVLNKIPDVSFNYFYFPVLTNDFFHINIKNYFKPISLFSEIEQINIEMVAKSHLSVVKSLEHEIQNNIYICWMQLWAMTFWYQDEQEKKLRFKELLEVIEKVYYHEIEVFNLIFEALSNYGLEGMIFKLFERLIHLKLNPTNTIRMLMMKQLEKEKFNYKDSKNIVNFVLENEHKLLPNTDPNHFRKRCIDNEWNYFLDNIQFYHEIHCIECHEKINLIEFSKNYKLMEKNKWEWLVCPNLNCKANILPKIKCTMGVELNLEVFF